MSIRSAAVSAGTFGLLVFTGLAPSQAVGAGDGARPSTRPPNIVLLMADDLGARELACYGNRQHQTPHLDRLAKDGARFRTCYSTPICSPSRVMILTGRYGFRTGWYNFTGRPGSPTYDDPDYSLVANETTFGDVLQAAGYRTLLTGKWQLPGKVPTLIHECGFDNYLIWAYKQNLPPGVEHTGRWEGKQGGRTARYWHPSLMRDGTYVPTGPEDYGPDRFTDFVLDALDPEAEQPVLVYYPMCLTHTPWERTPDPSKPGQKTPPGLKSNVEYLDHLVGRIATAIEERGLRDDTILVFTGDNGTQGAGKAEPTEAGVRVPLIVWGSPRHVKPGVVSDELVDLTDILPTLADWAGIDPTTVVPESRPLDGRSLARTLREGADAPPHREWIFSYLHDDRILRTDRWLIDGLGRMFDCGTARHQPRYREVTGSQEPEVVAARKRLEEILEGLPAPEGLEPCPYLQRHEERRRRQAERAADTGG